MLPGSDHRTSSVGIGLHTFHFLSDSDPHRYLPYLPHTHDISGQWELYLYTCIFCKLTRYHIPKKEDDTSKFLILVMKMMGGKYDWTGFSRL